LLTEAGGVFSASGVLSYLGLVRCEQGEFAAAAALLRDGLLANRESSRHEIIVRDLANLATLAQAVDRPELAARLFGVAQALAETIGYVFVLPERASYERAEIAARARLGDGDYAAAYAAGRALSLPQAVAEALAALDPATMAATPSVPAPPLPAQQLGLTPREIAVLRLLVAGRTDKEIGEALFISHRTAMGHVSNLLGKLGVPNRASAAEYARRHGLIA
jgi:DNA-binding CsgD family transcriptional regulator